MIGLAISIRTVPSAEILEKNRASSSFSGSILSSGVMATFRQNRATRVGRLVNGHWIRRTGNRPSERHAQIVIVPQYETWVFAHAGHGGLLKKRAIESYGICK